MRETSDKRLNPVTNFVIAGTAAAAGRAVVHPYSVVKIIAEVGAPGGKTGFVGGFYWLVRSQGLLGLTKGAPAAVARIFPHVGIQFAVFDQLASSPVFVRRRPEEQPNLQTVASTYFAGGIAGCVATLITHPLDVVKTRQIAIPLQKQPYANVVDALRTIVAREGVAFGLYRGLLPSLIGAFAFSGQMFTFWDIGDGLPWRRIGGEPFVPFEWFLVPCGAIIAASVATHPIDTIRRKMMARSPLLPKNGYVDVRFTNLLQCVANVYKYSGTSGFLFGVFANTAKVVPQLAVFWLTFKLLQRAAGGGLPNVAEEARHRHALATQKS